MLQLLTEYLAQAHQVTIPHIGSIRREHRPASWHPVDQQLQGPGYELSIISDDQPSEAQLEFLHDADSSETSLNDFGKQLLATIRQHPFAWPGVGSLRVEFNNVVLDAAIAGSYPPLLAERVIREDARHTIRIGEQEVASNFYEERVVVDESRQEALWLAWALVALALLLIGFMVYSGGFSPQSAGLRGPLPAVLP